MKENNRQIAGNILNCLSVKPHTQREIAKDLDLSLGAVNKHFKELSKLGFIGSANQITAAGQTYLDNSRTAKAIILAAGFGMRMIPLNIETPKGLLEVRGERLIERLINQLQERDIKDITIVVGHLKESYEYLIDKFNIKLVVNPLYSTTNSLTSLVKVIDRLEDSYILPCDLYFVENPFRHHEFSSWYGITEELTKHSDFLVHQRLRLHHKKQAKSGNHLLGIAFFHRDDVTDLREQLLAPNSEESEEWFWEDALIKGDQFALPARLFSSDKVFEFNSVKELRRFETKQLEENPILNIIAEQLQVSIEEIRDIKPLKHGMTNRSFDFRQGDQQYIMRIPGEGTEKLMNRRQEAEVNKVLQANGLAQELVFFNPETGHKIARRLTDARNCDATSQNEVAQAMRLLNDFHQLKLQVEHKFDLFGEIEHYDQLCGDAKSMFSDYRSTKKHIFSLKPIIEFLCEPLQLCHIDSVPDNFIFFTNQKGEGELTMIDWEYAGLQERYVDVAMFAIYAGYDDLAFDRLIDAYLAAEEANQPGRLRDPYPTLPYFNTAEVIRFKIYAYAAIAGLLWSNWCEYKRLLGVDFGEYTILQYRYAKNYYRKLIASPIYQTVLVLLNQKKLEKNFCATGSIDVSNLPENSDVTEPITQAIIMAAGRGERLRPLTETTPKPLTSPQGRPMIENLIEQLLAKGIQKIHIVVGYLAEQFDYLKDKYPSVNLHINPHYAECNNISSLYCVREVLYHGAVVILDGDQIINDTSCLKTRVSQSGYSCFYTAEPTDEWVLNWDEYVLSCQIGADRGWELKSLSFWCQKDAEQLADDVRELFESGNTSIYWDNIALFERPDNYHLNIHPISADAITEIDSYEEYLAYTKNNVL